MFACAGLRGSSKKNAVAVRRAARVMPVVQCKKVAVLGAAGGIGQPLSLLLKMNKCVTELALFDVAPIVKGVAVDLSHCNTPVQVCQICCLVAACNLVQSQSADGHASITDVTPHKISSLFPTGHRQGLLKALSLADIRGACFCVCASASVFVCR